MLNHYKVVFDVNNKHKKSTWFFFAPNRKMAAKFAIDFVKEEMKLGCYKSIKILSVKKF